MGKIWYVMDITDSLRVPSGQTGRQTNPERFTTMANPTLPGAQFGAPTAPAMPPSVRIATLLMYGLLGVFVLRTIATIAAQDALLDAFAADRGYDRDTQFGRLATENGAPAYTAIAIGSLLLFGGLLAVAAVYVQRAAGWARIVATVIAGLNVLGFAVVLGQPAPAWYKLFGIAAGLLAIGIIVLLYRSDSNAFFRRTPHA